MQLHVLQMFMKHELEMTDGLRNVIVMNGDVFQRIPAKTIHMT
jgi:hypothetical protein